MDSDVIIVGSGQAGVPLAKRLAKAGRRVLIAERGELGGTCVNTGCTPTKTMVASARAAHVARTAARLGVRVGAVEVDLRAVVERKDAIIRRWREGVMQRLASEPERISVVRGHARFVAPRTIEVNGERHSAPIVIIDVGCRPRLPDTSGLDRSRVLDNHGIMDLRELPRHLLVLGGGYIGCEFGQMFRRFGSDVTILDHNPHLIAHSDPDVSSVLERVFEGEGIRLVLGVKVEALRARSAGVAAELGDGRSFEGTHVLVAIGRRPNTDDLGCEAAGIALDARGYILAGEDYATSAEGVFAVGDVLGGPQFTHKSWDDHRALFERLEGRASPPRSAQLVPFTVFTDPQVAGVGLTETAARAQGIEHEVAVMPFGEIARAIETDETAGTMKVLLDPKTERFLGCHLVGAQAGELLHPFVTSMKANASARAMVDAEFVHPTFAEGLQTLVMRLPRYAL